MTRLVARVITLDQAVEAGCAYFLHHGTIDMDALASKIAVSRATLYRVVGSRDRLLGEVMWRLVSRSLARARARRTSDGVDGVLEVVRDICTSILASRPLRRFVTQEPEAASRLLGGASVGGVHARAVHAAQRLFAEVGLRPASRGDLLGDSMGEGRLNDSAAVADLVVRIVESACFASAPAARVQLELSLASIRGLLVEACATDGRRARLPRMRKLLDTAFCVAWTPVPNLFGEVAGSLQAVGL
jgi:AcrR family transcriptional regulator